MVLAHGQNRKMVDEDLVKLGDIDGKPFIKETVDLAKGKSAFWMGHRFTNPVTGKVEPMQMYCERLDDSVICSEHFMQDRRAADRFAVSAPCVRTWRARPVPDPARPPRLWRGQRLCYRPVERGNHPPRQVRPER